MKKTFYFLFYISLISKLFAAPLVQKTFHENSFKDAKKADHFIRFQNGSKQFGFITHDYEGYVLDYKIQYEMVKNVFTSLRLEIPINSIDTDNPDRNKKMREYCFESHHHPYLTISANSPVKISEEEQVIDGKINIRGLDKPIKISLKAEGKGFQGNAKLSFKDLEIPDPSIAIATIKDDILVEFRILLNQ